MTFVCLFAIKHLQGVIAFVVLCGVDDFNPNSLNIATRLCPGFLINPLLPVGQKVLGIRVRLKLLSVQEKSQYEDTLMATASIRTESDRSP